MTTFTIYTLGCKVNFYESEWIRERLLALGATESNGLTTCPEWVIINTCTVTARADRQSRQLIYRAARQCPKAEIIITGCYADRDPETLKALPNVRHILPNDQKPRIPEILLSLSTPFDGWMMLSTFKRHVRAYLMVQNGCNANCSYCIIPKVRGKNRSKPIDILLRELESLKASGHTEIVLCGIHLGLYGRDLSPPASLSSLLQAIEAHPFKGRIRISSLEPMELHKEIIQTISVSGKICPHLHIPLQSGEGETLKRMHRPYTPESFRALIRAIREALPDCTIGSDVIVGFPGETEATFEQTCHFIEELPFSYLHVFPYSDRPGTFSETLSDKVDATAKKERAARLLELARQKRRTFFDSWVGKDDQVIFEERKGENIWSGKSAHYLPVWVESPQNLLGKMMDVKITSAAPTHVWGEI